MNCTPLQNGGSDKSLTNNQLEELLDQILIIEDIYYKLRRRGISLTELLKVRQESERTLPLYKIISDAGVEYAFTEKEFTKIVEDFHAANEESLLDPSEENGGDSPESHPQLNFEAIECFETQELEPILKKLEKKRD